MTRLLLTLCAALGLGCARRLPSHRPMAFALVALLAIDLTRWPLDAPLRAPGPVTGELRWLLALDTALMVAWPAVTLALCLHVFARRSWWPAAALAILTSAALIVSYPSVRGALLLDAFRWTRVGAVTLGVTALLLRPRRGWLSGVEVPTALLLGEQAVELGGPWLAGDPVRDWWLATLATSVVYVVLAGILAVQWLRAAREGRA